MGYFEVQGYRYDSPYYLWYKYALRVNFIYWCQLISTTYNIYLFICERVRLKSIIRYLGGESVADPGAPPMRAP